MTQKQLISEVMKREGGKSNLKIGDMREVFRILTELEDECARKKETGPAVLLIRAANRLASKRKKK